MAPQQLSSGGNGGAAAGNAVDAGQAARRAGVARNCWPPLVWMVCTRPSAS